MSFALFQHALLQPLEFTINRVLAMDAASNARLARLEGKTLALHVSAPATVLFISVRSRGLHLHMLHEAQPDASLHGALPALAGLLLRREPLSNLRPQQLELRGDTAFVQALQALLLDLDLDWEYHLGKVLGDVPVSLLGEGLRNTRDLLRQAGRRLQEDTQEYLHEETRLFPAADELAAYYGAVSDLSLRVDRLRARIELLVQK
jgi:ubiquinone biosynthesis protein UbiJ